MYIYMSAFNKICAIPDYIQDTLKVLSYGHIASGNTFDFSWAVPLLLCNTLSHCSLPVAKFEQLTGLCPLRVGARCIRQPLIYLAQLSS